MTPIDLLPNYKKKKQKNKINIYVIYRAGGS